MSSGSAFADTRAGLRIDMADLTTGKFGSMTASVANGFGHILYRPKSTTCQEKPYAFHPEYSTGIPRGNTWSAHTYNVSMSDEIGHFENCLAIDAQGDCTKAGGQDPVIDSDDTGCVPGTDSLLVKIDGCFASDRGCDWQSIPPGLAGHEPERRPGPGPAHPSPILFTSPTSRGRNYPTIAFEADLPRIEASDSQANPPFCDRTTGANCVDPHGAQFHPFYSTTVRYGSCTWQEGGKYLPRTTNDFSGSSTANTARC